MTDSNKRKRKTEDDPGTSYLEVFLIPGISGI
jgi:hypothetical protein